MMNMESTDRDRESELHKHLNIEVLSQNLIYAGYKMIATMIIRYEDATKFHLAICT